MRAKATKATRRRHKKIIKLASGYRLGRNSQYKLAKQAVMKAGLHAYKHRRQKKRDFRSLWITRLNAALANYDSGYKYGTFIHKLKENNIELNRKILSELAINNETIFRSIVGGL